MQPTTQPESRRLTLVAGALLGFAMLLLRSPYAGIDHDATLYLGQALLQRSPEIFGHDMFFAHGGQSRYTLFPWLVSHSFDWFDPPQVFLWGTLANLLLFAGAGWYCLSGLLAGRQRYWAWLGVLCLPAIYGRSPIFSYGEPFLTPRPISETMCLLGIGLLARNHRIAAVCALVLSGLFHPLQATAAMLVVWPWLVLQNRRWLHAAWLVIPVALLGFTDIRPFNDLLRPIDPAWLANLRVYTGQLFITEWPIGDYKALSLDTFLLATAWRTLHARFGRWCAAALIGLALGLATNLVLVDGLHLVLPAGLQLWRVHWLAHWLAMASLAALLYRDIVAREASRALCLCLAALLAWGVPGWAWLLFAALHAGWPALSARMQPRITTLLGGLFALGLLLLLTHHVATELLNFGRAHYRLDLYAFDRRLLFFAPIALGLPLLGVCLWDRLGAQARWLLLAVALCPLIAWGVWRWDARPPIQLALERNAFRSDLFGVALPENAQIMWDRVSVTGNWLVLQRADYFSPQQLSGMVFSRDATRDARNRLGRLHELFRQSTHCQDLMRMGGGGQCHIDETGLRQACAPGPVAPPDFIILPYQQPQRALGTWSITDPVTHETLSTYRLYRCADAMAELEHGPMPAP